MFRGCVTGKTPVALSDIMPSGSPGEVSEWSIVQSWKDCLLKGSEGSNPSLSGFLIEPLSKTGDQSRMNQQWAASRVND